MTEKSSPSIVLSTSNLALLAATSTDHEALKGDLSAAVNLLFPYGISRYKALVKDAQKRGSNPPGSNPGTKTRAPRTPKAAASRSAVTDALTKAAAEAPKRGSSKLEKQTSIPGAEESEAGVEAKQAAKEEHEAAKIAAKMKKDDAKIASLAAAKAEEAKKTAAKEAKKPAAGKSNGSIANGKSGKKDEPNSKGDVWWIVKIGKQEVQVAWSKDDRDGAIKEALSQINGAKLSQVKSAEIEVE